jgi:hypothetical protein
MEKKPTHTPMNPKVKKWVKGVRGTQLGLRVITLLGALASLFCSIVIKNADTTVIWIMRAGVSLQFRFMESDANHYSPLSQFYTLFTVYTIFADLLLHALLAPKLVMECSLALWMLD